MKEKKKEQRAVKSVKSFWDASPSDVLGSYTGVADDPFETPVQDADDLQ